MSIILYYFFLFASVNRSRCRTAPTCIQMYDGLWHSRSLQGTKDPMGSNFCLYLIKKLILFYG